MEVGRFEVGTMIKGKDLKRYELCKILTEDMKMRRFQYQMGMNEDIKLLALSGSCKSGLHFCLVQDICEYISYGTKLAIVRIPDDEDVFVDDRKFRTHRLFIEKVLPLCEKSTWEYLVKNGADITAGNNYAVRNATRNGNLEVVKYLHEHGTDITEDDERKVMCVINFGKYGIEAYFRKVV